MAQPAQQPQKRGTLPKNPIGNGIGGFSQFERASAVQAGQHTDARNDDQASQDVLQDLMGDTGLSDNSSFDDVVSKPLLELAKRSYAANDNAIPPPFAGEDTEGGGLVRNSTDEIQRSRNLQEQQLQSRQDLMGHMSNGRGATSQGSGQTTSNTQNTPPPQRAQTSSGGQTENGPAQQLLQDQASSISKKAIDDAKAQLKQKIKDQIDRAIKQTVKKATSGALRIGVETAEAVAGPEDVGLTWATLVVEMNLQLISKYIFKGLLSFAASSVSSDETGGLANEIVDTVVPTQSFAEDFLTILMDIFLILAVVWFVMMTIIIFFGPVLLALGIGYMGIQQITDLFK